MAGLTVGILDLELFMQRLDIVLDPLDQQGLILEYGPANVRTNKETVETWKDPEHLVCVLGRSKLVSKTSCDAFLDSVYAFVIPGLEKYISKEMQKHGGSGGKIWG